ncbi:MAG: transcription antitermination factor NusB [bacterium]|nr:transcription antitermination factor NusB [bacterium]
MSESENNFLEFDPEDVIDVEVIEHPAPAHDHSLARRVAIQVLYEVDSADHLVGEVLQRQAHINELPAHLGDYLRDLVLGVIDNHRSLDNVIKSFAPEFPLNQVAIIDRNILRIAIYEFAIKHTVVTGIAIDEAVELAKLYGADGSARFINGVLGAIADDRKRLNKLLNAPKPFEDATQADE